MFLTSPITNGCNKYKLKLTVPNEHKNEFDKNLVKKVFGESMVKKISKPAIIAETAGNSFVYKEVETFNTYPFDRKVKPSNSVMPNTAAVYRIPAERSVACLF